MCGIIGVVGSRRAAKVITTGLRNLEYRGYDSCGIAILDDSKKLVLRKNVGSPGEVSRSERFQELDGSTGIGHTRWATHGGVTRTNSHPHTSPDGQFAVVHNGIVRNHTELRRSLEDEGRRFVSETDTEVIVHLIAREYQRNQGDVEQAFTSAMGQLEGSYAVVMITSHQPDRLYGVRTRTPLVVGIGAEEMYLASDYSAFVEETRRIVHLEDGEYVVIQPRGHRIRRLEDHQEVERPVLTVDWDVARSRKGGHAHFMLKEIHEQPEAIQAVLDLESEPIESMARELLEAPQVYLMGVGTTYYVALLCSYYARELTGRYYPAISSDEFPNLAVCDPQTRVLAFSQSGETYDTLSALRFAREGGARTAAVVNVLGSSMVREVDRAILQGSGPEICVLSTKAAVAQVVVFLRVALEMARLRGEPVERIRRWQEELELLPSLVRRLLDERQAFLNGIARRRAHIPNWLFLGRGIYYAVALEAALKMKEVTYQHAEGMQGGFMKHGTIALIDPNMASIFFFPPESEDELFQASMGNLSEVKARGGFTVGLHFGEPSGAFDEEVVLPKAPRLAAPILELVAGQLLAYFSAVCLKRNVDRPRSLAKSVTVE